MRTTTASVMMTVAFLAVAGVSAGAAAAGRAHPTTAAPTTVTIKADGTDLSGTISSPKPMRCADGRTVLLIKQKGARGGGDDQRFGSDTAELDGGVYRWSTGTTGTEGKFYAKVKPIDGCSGDTSPTVKAQR